MDSRQTGSGQVTGNDARSPLATYFSKSVPWMSKKTPWIKKIWLILVVGFRCWPLNLWLGFLRSGSIYLKTDFGIGFLVSLHISENYSLLQKWSITWWPGDYFRLVYSRLRDTCMHRNKSTWVPKGPLLPSEFVLDRIQALAAFSHDFSWFFGFQKIFMVPAEY